MKQMYNRSTGPLRGYKGYSDGDSGIKSFKEYVHRLAEMNSELPEDQQYESLIEESRAIARQKENIALRNEAILSKKMKKWLMMHLP